MITTRWLENLVNRNISNYEEKIRAEGLTKGRTEGRTERPHRRPHRDAHPSSTY